MHAVAAGIVEDNEPAASTMARMLLHAVGWMRPFSIACTAGVPGLLAALSLAYCSNLFGSTPHYGSGQGAVYYGAGYVNLKEIFSMDKLSHQN